MIKVCHVTSSHKRYDGRIFYKECVSLSQKYDVSLLCSDLKPNESLKNVNIISIGVNNLSKIKRFLVIPRKLKKECIKLNADVYHFHDPELMSLAGYMKKKGKSVIFDSHEDNLGLLTERKWIPNYIKPLVKKIFVLKEKKVLSKIDAIITVSPHIVKRLSKYNKSVYMITNYPIYNNSIKKKNFDNYICFAGGIDEQWNHQNVISSLKGIDIKYKVAGPLSDSYKEILQANPEFNKVEYLGKISKDEVLKLYENASVGMALCKDSINVDGHNGSLGNTKLFEYMASGVPIICTDFVLWKKIIKKYNCGICVDYNNTDQIHKAICKILEDKAYCLELSKNGMKAAKTEFNWSTQEKILFDLYGKVERKLNFEKE